MKLKNILYSMMMGTAVLTGTTSCVSDLDQYPHTETTSKDVYTSLAITRLCWVRFMLPW